MPHITSDILINRVYQNFPINPIPNDIGTSGEDLDVNKFFNGKSWPEITLAELEIDEGIERSGYYHYMTNEGYAYYIPAYIKMTLTELNENNRWLIEGFLLSLCPKERDFGEDENVVRTEKFIDKRFMQKIASLTSDQKQDIADFLVHQITHQGAEPVNFIREWALDAYNAYWHEFATVPYLADKACNHADKKAP